MIFIPASAMGVRKDGVTMCIQPAHTMRVGRGSRARIIFARSASYAVRAVSTLSGCCFLYGTRLWYVVGIEAMAARVRPYAALRLEEYC